MRYFPTLETLEARDLMSVTFDPGTRVLTVDDFGDPAGHNVSINCSLSNVPQVRDNADVAGPFANVARIIVLGADGAMNSLVVAGRSSIPVEFYGGSGADNVTIGTDGNTILDGGGGANTLIDGGGKGVLLAGDGPSYLSGGGGDDLIMAGKFAGGTALPVRQATLRAVQEAWLAGDRALTEARVLAFIHDNNAADTVLVGGGNNFCFADLSGPAGSRDILKDGSPNNVDIAGL